MSGKKLKTIQNTGVEDVRRPANAVNRLDHMVEMSRRLTHVRSRKRETLDLYRVLSHEEHKVYESYPYSLGTRVSLGSPLVKAKRLAEYTIRYVEITRAVFKKLTFEQGDPAKMSSSNSPLTAAQFLIWDKLIRRLRESFDSSSESDPSSMLPLPCSTCLEDGLNPTSFLLSDVSGWLRYSLEELDTATQQAFERKQGKTPGVPNNGASPKASLIFYGQVPDRFLEFTQVHRLHYKTKQTMTAPEGIGKEYARLIQRDRIRRRHLCWELTDENRIRGYHPCRVAAGAVQ